MLVGNEVFEEVPSRAVEVEVVGNGALKKNLRLINIFYFCGKCVFVIPYLEVAGVFVPEPAGSDHEGDGERYGKDHRESEGEALRKIKIETLYFPNANK